jgi:heterodisulfide reductase subunit B
MKVVKAGEDFKPVPTDCGWCHAELLCDELKDFTRVQYSDYKENWDYLAVNCPCCAHQINLDLKVIPVRFRELIYRRQF